MKPTITHDWDIACPKPSCSADPGWACRRSDGRPYFRNGPAIHTERKEAAARLRHPSNPKHHI